MRFRALGVALLLPLGLLAACGGEDGGLASARQPADDAESTPDATEPGDDESSGDDSSGEPSKQDGDALPPEIRDQVVEQVMSQFDLTEEQAGCMVDELVAIFGVEDLADMGSAGGVPQLDPDQMGAVVEIFETCDIDPSVLTG